MPTASKKFTARILELYREAMCEEGMVPMHVEKVDHNTLTVSIDDRQWHINVAKRFEAKIRAEWPGETLKEK